MASQKRYLEIFNSAVGIRGRKVLEVGGCVLPGDLEGFGPKEWTSIDINPRRLDSLRGVFIPEYYHYHQMSVTGLTFQDDYFDLVYSINCFEHVDDMRKALSEMYRVLKPGGILFSIFGPIWSSPVGHHTYIEDGEKVIHFNDKVFPDWYHLICSRKELMQILAKSYRAEIVDQIVEYVYDSNDLNRMVDGEYHKLINESGFGKALVYCNKKGKKPERELRRLILDHYPGVVDPRTTEILCILYKRDLTIPRFVRIYTGLLSRFLQQKMA